MLLGYHCPQIAEQLRKRITYYHRVVDTYYLDYPAPSHTGVNSSLDKDCNPELLIQLGNLSNLGQMAAGIVHEIRNPLASLKGFLQMLGMEWQGGDNGREYIKLMLEEIEGINEIAGELLCLARPSQPQREPCDLGEVIGEVVSLLRGQAILCDIDMDYSIVPVNLPTTIADTKKIKQAILNLVCNAIQAMPEGGLINIGVTYLKAADGFVITITDTGPGIDENILPQIFTPFFTTKGKGGGLGLHIVKTIIDNHGGSIKINSTRGQGTTCKIWLPRLNF